jgi:DNA topoisomerase-3
MSKILIIGEKPSVAADIAKALGGFTKSGSVYEREDVVISSGLGHLVELKVPDGEDKGWSLANLPIMPPAFGLKPIEKTKAQLDLLKKLFKRPDIDTVVNACDAGREGELIFRYIHMACDRSKPIRRMWFQSMTTQALKDAFANMLPGKDKESLFAAAQCRAEADFLVGVNATRALTSYRQLVFEDDPVSSAGRVQSPLLYILYERYMKRKHFVPTDFWEIHGTFAGKGGTYLGRWINPDFVKTGAEGEKEDRLFDKDAAERIAAECRAQHPSDVKDVAEVVKKHAGSLFDLTTLQREANTKFGFSAADTLKIAQSLYEVHKATTYPRTDAKALPEDYIGKVPEILGELTQPAYAAHAARIMDGGWVKPNKKIFDNTKISDHFAIIPTSTIPKNLSDDESKIYDLVVRRFLAIFFPAAEFNKTVRTTTVAAHRFKSVGSVLIEEGWMAVYGREADEDGGGALTKVDPGEAVQTIKVETVGMQTKKPDLYTDATLLSAMEHAGRLVEDADLQEAMQGKGLGTPATRAATIEALISPRAYARREKKFIDITDRGVQIVKLLLDTGLEVLTSPSLTGEWEYKLSLVETGELSRADFMKGIREETDRIVQQIKAKARGIPVPESAILKAPCPKCQGQVKQLSKAYTCGGCGLAVPRELLQRRLSIEDVEKLMADKQTPQLANFISGKGKKFEAALKFSDDMSKLEFVFPVREAPQKDESTVVGACPKCGSDVIPAGGNYDCEKSYGEAKSCNFRVWGTAAKKTVSPDQVKKLLSEKRTDLIEGMVGKSGKAFSAFLVLQKDHTVAFEFPPRTK